MAMLRITSSKVVPYAIRAISFRGALAGLITNAFNGCDQNSMVSFAISHHFSTDAKKQNDCNLVKIIKSEIKLKQMFQYRNMPEVPYDLPFTFEDNPWEDHITLSRVLDGEKIDVVVLMPYCWHILNNDDTDGDVTDDISSANNDVMKLRLIVTVSKENGKISEFDVSAYPDGRMQIHKYALLKESASESNQPLQRFGPHHVSEGGDLEYTLRKFLKIRGIRKTSYRFLFEYMLNKCEKGPVVTLKELRNFIAE